MNEYEGHKNSVATQVAGTGEHKSAFLAELEKCKQTPAGAGDLTPTPSRPTSPHQARESSARDTPPSTNGSKSTTRLTNGTGSCSKKADRVEGKSSTFFFIFGSRAEVMAAEFTVTSANSLPRSTVTDRLHAYSAADTERGPSGTSTVYDTRLPSSPDSLLPSRSLTPKYRYEAFSVYAANRNKDMSDSSSHPAPTSGPRPTPSRRQQQSQQPQPQSQHQQRGLQPYGYYASSSTSESGFPRNLPSMSSQGGHQSLAHTQQPTTMQRSAGFVGQYTMTPPSSSLYPQHQVQHQYTYSQLNIPGMPPLPHTHSHTPPEFYPVGHSASPSLPPLYAPSFHTSIAQEHAATPALTFDYERAGNSGRSPSAGPSSPYATQQPFAPFSFHPTITATPQFTHSHSPFSSPFPAQQSQHTQQQYPPPSYMYMTRASPSSTEDISQPQQQPPATWWFIPPHSASPSTGPYPNMYYVEAYGNPSNPGPGLGQAPGLPSLPSPSSSRTMPPSAISMPDLSGSSGPGSGMGASAGGPQRPLETPSKPGSNTSSRAHPSPSPLALGESVTENGHQQSQQELQQGEPKRFSRRSFLPNPPVHRSEWVMWIGNVPSDATHDELWRFFTRPVSPSIPLTAELRSPYRQQQPQPPHLPAGLLSPTGSSSASDTNPADTSGVQSVFLIARSNCAFVNYASEEYLAAAVQRFNGIPLRPGDPRCPRLVCRVRGKDEDLRAGVGAQRGTGVHTRWVREQRERAREQQDKRAAKNEGALTDTETSASEPPGTPLSTAVTESGTEASTQSSGRPPPHHSSSSGSTTSGFLSHYFPKRYFILKSLTQYDLDLSVEKGVWATQPHNETVLNQAFRNSSDVYLIFSVNKSGEFYGYARMAGPIGKAAVDRVSWASRTDSQPSQHTHSPAASFVSSVAGMGSQVGETIPEENEGTPPESKEGNISKGKERDTVPERPVMIFSPSEHRLSQDSPQPVTPATQKRLSTAEEMDTDKIPISEGAPSAPLPDQGFRDSLLQSSRPLMTARPTTLTTAPAVMGPQYRPITSARTDGLASETLDPRMLRRHLPQVELDPEAPYRAMRGEESHASSRESSVEDADRVKRRDTLNKVASVLGGGSKLREVLQAESPEPPEVGPDMQGEHGDRSPQWGSPFKVQWIRTQRLPFSRTRHLRNPWNHEREVKVSRDGTELEPTTGQALLDEWDKEDPEPLPPAPPSGGAGAAVGRRGPHYRKPQSSQTSTMVETVGSGPGSPRPHQQKQRPR
ncbi:hypothetical protein ACEPAF_9551 [Sanghuangporus sanghuang]